VGQTISGGTNRRGKEGVFGGAGEPSSIKAAGGHMGEKRIISERNRGKERQRKEILKNWEQSLEGGKSGYLWKAWDRAGGFGEGTRTTSRNAGQRIHAVTRPSS